MARPRTRPTRSGRLAIVGAIVLTALGVATQIREFVICGVFLACLVVGALIVAGWGRLRLRLVRQVGPRRLPVGEVCHVRLAITPSRFGGRLPLILLDRLNGAEIAVGTVPAGTSAAPTGTSYRIRTDRRGISKFGDVTVTRLDPFGLARCTRTFEADLDVLVLPRVHPLRAQATRSRTEPTEGQRAHRVLAPATDEFDTLRDYVPGDDVRRVHWPSTARLARPVVRTHQQPWQRRSIVVLDTRTSVYPDDAVGGEAFERAVSAAASVLVALHRAGDHVRLVCTDGSDTGYLDDAVRVEATLDLLAVTTQHRQGDLRNLAGMLARGGDKERLVICSGRPGHDEASEVLAGSGARGESALIACSTPLPAELARIATPFGEHDRLADAWERIEPQPSIRST